MTNLKKTLAVVLAFAMILSMGAVSTFAYTDVAEGTIVSEAVDILSGLNILTGFEDGTFRPDETVTRAQMAAIICRTLGYEDQAQSSMGSTVFNDVAADHWASGYINVAQAQQIINGYGDGNYGPEDLVTYEQAVKMIVSALGYDLAANAKGGYPTGYLAIASAEGITKNANGKVGDAAARSSIAVLVYNALDVRLMDQELWSTDGTDTYEKSKETILSQYLDVTKWEGIVVGTPITGVATDGKYNPEETPKVGIQGGYFYYSDKGSLNKQPYVADDGTVLTKRVNADKVDVNDLLGKTVIAYIGEDEVTGADTVFAIAESKNKNTVKKISANQLVKSGEKYDNEADVIGYTEIGSNRALDLKLDNAKVYKNYLSMGTSIDTTTELRSEVLSGGVIEFISNDGDEGDYEYVNVLAYSEEVSLEEIEENNGVYLFNGYDGSTLSKVDVDDEDQLVVVYKDGVLATVADLAANDTVSVVRVTPKKEVQIFFASSATVTGVVNAYDPVEDIVTIAGTDYELSPSLSKNAEELSGEEGTFFLNVDGQIAWNETAPTAVGKYALIVASYVETSGVNTGKYIQAVLADGTVAEYEISKTAKVVDFDNKAINTDGTRSASGDGKTVIATDAAFKAYFDNYLSQLNTDDTFTAPGDGKTPTETYKATRNDLMAANELVVNLTVSNGKVSKAKLVAGTPVTGASGKYNADSARLASNGIDEDTVAFSIKDAGAAVAIDPDDITVGTVADFLSDDDTCSYLSFYDKKTGSTVYGAVVGFDMVKAVKDTNSVFVVSKKRTTTYGDENGEAYVVTGMQNGEEVSYTIYNEDASKYGFDPTALVAGDILLLGDADAEGVISEGKLLLGFDKSNPGTPIAYNKLSSSDIYDEISSGYGVLQASDKTSFKMAGGITKDNSAGTHFTAPGSETGYTKSANYVLVDFSESTTPDIYAESPSKYLFDYDGYVTYVYARAVEGTLVDVVVYRMAEKTELTASISKVVAGAASITIVDNADSIVVNSATCSNGGVTVGTDCTVTGTLAEGDTITLNVTLVKAGYTNKTMNISATVVAAS